jgi:uncharacterized protein YbjQ (UPF0145 family)/cold shock CspA family protein
MHGKIISKAGDYGFIHCAKGVAHYFNRKLLGEGVRFDDLWIGAPVHFEPVAGPKGMRAKQVSQRHVQYGWTAGEFIVLKGDDAIPIQVADVLPPPNGEGERYLSAFAEFTVPIKGDRDQVLNTLIERVKACGANAIDMLKTEIRTLKDGDAKGSWEVLTGRIAHYRTSVEVESDEQYHALVDEFYLICDDIHPQIIDLQTQLDDENLAFQIHIPYFIGNTFLTLKQGEGLNQDKTLLCGVQITSPWYRDFNAGKDELVKQAQAVGANCITEMTRLQKTASEGNYKYTMYSWVGYAGVWGRRKQVSDEQESERLNEANKAHCDAVQARLSELGSQLNMRREDQSFLSSGGVLVVVVIIVVVVLLALIS